MKVAKPNAPFDGAPEGAKVHQGFLNEWNSLKDDVINEVMRLRSSGINYDILVTGHSLGGAIATLCSIELYTSLKLKSRLFTLNPPRVGNSVFASWLDSLPIEHSFVVNNNDLTPHLPYKWLGFRHAGRQIWIDGEETFECDPEDNNCANSAKAHDLRRHSWVWDMRLGINSCEAVALDEGDSSDS